ncbi:MAG: hypothetical protein SGPRY_013862, partial [Prymnesium sp.]
MPKRATHTYESEKDGIKDAELNVHYCMCCGESVLILGPSVDLASLPRRKTDCAYVLERGTTIFKLKSKPGQTKLLRRCFSAPLSLPLLTPLPIALYSHPPPPCSPPLQRTPIDLQSSPCSQPPPYARWPPRRPQGFERQYRLNCWSCGVPIAYRSEDSESARLTYVLFDATGLQADLYLQLYQVPPCIQPTGERSVRVAMEVAVAQAKKAITHVSNAEIGVSVCAPSQEGLANSEVIDLMSKVLGVARSQLQLSRGWSLKSKFLLVSNTTAVEVFKAIRGSVETDILPISMQ